MLILLSVVSVFLSQGLLQPEQTDAEAAFSQASLGTSFTRLATDGPSQVIVELSVPFQPEGTLAGQSERAAQRRRIAQVQNAVRQRVPGKNVKQFEGIPFIAMAVDAVTIEALRRDPDVKSIVEDQRRSLSLRESVAIIGADSAWAQGYSGAGQTVAVLDTGVERTHPFFAGKVVAEACFSTTSRTQGTTSLCPGGAQAVVGPGTGVNCPASLAGCEHGTHVAGIAAGKQLPLGAGTIAGVAKDAQVIAIQVFSRRGDSVTAYDSDIINGLTHVFALRGDPSAGTIAAVNLSLGGGSYMSVAECDADPSNRGLKSAIGQLRSVGIPSIVAAGNDGSVAALSAPACLSSAVSVGSTTKSDSISTFSNSASFLSLLAPGEVITSAVPGGWFANLRGTSMAAPHVAGAWAVLKSKAPDATIEQVLQALQSTGKGITDARNGITRPRIQLHAALASVIVPSATPTATPAPPPTATPTPPPTTTPALPPTTAPAPPPTTTPVVGDEQGTGGPWTVYIPLVSR